MSVSTPAVPASSPDEVVHDVGAAYTPLETGSTVLLGILSLLISGLLGLLLSTLADEHRLAASGIGLAAMLEALSTGLVTGLAGAVLKPRRLRLVAAVASVALIAINLATLRTSGGGILAIRALAGLPEGLLLWIAIGFIARTQTPERWAAVLFTGMGITQLGAATLLTAYILPRFGANGGYVMLACAAALGLPLTALIPRALADLPTTEGGGGAPPPKGWIALFATLCYAAPIAAVAVYVVPFAHEAGLSTGVGRTAISVGLACQILGGALATVLAGRVRYITIFWFCAAALLATWTTYAVSAPAALFVGMAGLGGLCGGLGGPFLVPMTIEVDPTRRTAMQSGAVQLLAGAFGPLLAAMVVGERETHGVIVLSAALLLVGLAVMVGLHRSAQASRAAAAA
ncbi:MAG TPA: hypothetical protein VFW13_03310 [Phenylobacterium sp.]|nr:hypothetical protein [Phenylobacterium sp.]